MEDRKRQAKGLKVPLVIKESELETLQLIELKPFQALFARAEGCQDPHHDILKAFVTDNSERILASPDREAYDHSMDEMIGDENSRTSAKPTRPIETDGDSRMLEGGAAFERAIGHNHSNAQGPRCYSLGLVAESGTKILGPSMNHQLIRVGHDEALERIKRTSQVRNQRFFCTSTWTH